MANVGRGPRAHPWPRGPDQDAAGTGSSRTPTMELTPGSSIVTP
jgi:hypothetical protein